MTRITNADHVLALLRAQLERAERARKRSAKAPSAKNQSLSATDRVRQLASTDSALSEGEIERALIAGLLADQFGAAVANDPSYQRVVDEVIGMINRDAASTALLKRAIVQLREKL